MTRVVVRIALRAAPRSIAVAIDPPPLRHVHFAPRRRGRRARRQGALQPQLRPRAQLVLQYVLAAGGILLHNDELAVVDVAQILKVLDAEVVPK